MTAAEKPASASPHWTPAPENLEAVRETWGHAHRQGEPCPDGLGHRVIPAEWDQDAKAVKDALAEVRQGLTALRSTLQALRDREEGPYSFMDTARVVRDAEGLLTAGLVLLYPEVAKWRGQERERACLDVLYPSRKPDPGAPPVPLEECLSAVLAGAVWRGFDGPDGVSKDEALEYAGVLATRVKAVVAWPGWDTPPTWPEGTVPSIEETALWLGLLTPPDRVRFAQRLEEVQRMASECFQMDHLGCIERQASVLEARLPQWWSPDGNHYWAPTGPPAEYPWGLPHGGAE